MDASALAGLYEGGFYEKGAQRFRISLAERIMRWFRVARARKIHGLLNRPSRVLDVGCGRGFTLAALQSLGHEVHGTQLSTEALAFARESLHLAHIEPRDLLEIGYPEGWFDAITIYHVLEHMGDPIALLREAARILRPGGLLIVEVPHAGGLGARLAGRYWLGWDVPFHRFHFTRATLQRALTGVGLRAERWTFPTLEYGPALLVLSVVNMLTLSENFLFRSLSYTNTRISGDGKFRMCLHMGLAALAALPCVVLALIGSALNRGETISVHIRKVLH